MTANHYDQMPPTAPFRRMEASPPVPTPAFRRLRVYAFDPAASLSLETSIINEAVVKVPWESPWEDPVTVGPCNDYLEVVDHDLASGLFYAPVDLNEPLLLAQDGLPPSEGRPQFHQQMVFAVAMTTIKAFERALGRPAMWACHLPDQEEVPEEHKADPGSASGGEPGAEHARNHASDTKPTRLRFTKRLRIYPHAFRSRNAYYSPAKGALLFGYFSVTAPACLADGEWVFTCLSQDIVAHETSHALLHGLQRRSVEVSNLDTLAFHEAFADVVALFQHFTMTDVLAQQIAASRGTLRSDSLLMSLARQFGEATGRGGALRYALDNLRTGSQLNSAQERAETRNLANAVESHERGSFLVAAVFDAFVAIFERRTADLLRLATGGSVPDGRELSAELVNRLAKEAHKTADHFLRICVRALDYLPPVDVRLGEYLRAMISADADLVLDDPLGYRVAIAASFRKRGIPVPGCISLAPDSLAWEAPDLTNLPALAALARSVGILADLLPNLRLGLRHPRACRRGQANPLLSRNNLREENFRTIEHNRAAVLAWLSSPASVDGEMEQLLGVRKALDAPASIERHPHSKLPLIDVDSANVALRAGPDGQELHQLIIQVSQRRRAYLDAELQKMADAGHLEKENPVAWAAPDFWFQGGATLHVDLRDGRLKRVIRKRIDDDVRLQGQRDYLKGGGKAARVAFAVEEPFAHLHAEVSS